MVCSKRFWYAPSVARAVETPLIASSIAVIASDAPVTRSSAATPSPVESKPVTAVTPPNAAVPRLTVIWSALAVLAPTWKVPT